jgi:hypothetical protein
MTGRTRLMAFSARASFIDPNRNLVIASNASWTSALGDTGGEWEARKAFYKAVQHAIDMEAASPQGDAAP